MTENENIEYQQLLNNIAQSTPSMNAALNKLAEVTEIADKKSKYEDRKGSKGKFFLRYAIIMILGAILFSRSIVMSFIIPIVAFVYPIFMRSYYGKKLKETEAEIDKATNEYNVIINNPVNDWIPQDYKNPIYFAKIAEYVRNKRAFSLKEAFDLLEEDIHRQKMENKPTVINNTYYRY